MIMAIKCLQKCGDVCQQSIAGVLVVLMGLLSFAAIILVVLSF
jgi:hypothetical protein